MYNEAGFFDELSHFISLSQDGGQTFNILVVDVKGNQFSFEATSSIFSDTVLIRVNATDGVNTAGDTSDGTFTVETFSAGGQRNDVNKFLTYSDPTQKTISLPTGTTQFTVIIRYGNTIDAATFTAVLNTIDITQSFSPSSGTFEFVTIPLEDGRNTLKLTIDGIRDDGKTATDRDSLVFKVG